MPERRDGFGARGLWRVHRQGPDGRDYESSVDHPHRPDACAALHASAPGAHRDGEIDPSFVITHRMRLGDAAQGFSLFNDKEDECLKVVLRPN